jgi:hypothetical protein
MYKRLWLSLLIAAALLIVLTVAVTAQNTVIDDPDDETTNSAPLAQIEPITTTIRQQVPVSVTLRIPLGATDTQTVTIPMLLSLNLQLSLGELVTPSLVLTADVAGLQVGITPTTTRTVAATPTRVPPTATPRPPSPTPTAAPATPTAVPATPTAAPVITPTIAVTTTTGITTTDTPTTTGTTTTTDTTTDTTTVFVPECADPRATIIFPGVNQTISGTVDVLGSATHENFAYFKLEYANGADASQAAEYFYLGGGNSPVENGVLAAVDTEPLANGAYTLRLTVVDNTGNFPEPCRVTVQVAN